MNALHRLIGVSARSLLRHPGVRRRTPVPRGGAVVRPKRLAGLLALLGAAAATAAEDPFANAQVQAIAVSGGVYMLTGVGGNIGLSVGDDGVLIVDDQFLPLAERIQDAIDGLVGDGVQAPKFVLNTHHHGDHVGGNPHFGQRAHIIAHHNVRRRLVDIGAMPPPGLPVITFDRSLSLHFNSEEIALLHLPAGHTDGDAAVWFKGSGVLHMGDQLFNGRFPYIDQDAGGTVQGYLANLRAVLDWAPADIKIIPGHGPLCGLEAVRAMIEAISATRGAVAQALAAGASVAAVVQAGLGDEYAAWGAGFINEERWIRILARDLNTPASE